MVSIRIPIRREFSVPLERVGRGVRSPHDPRGPALHERDIYGTDLGRLHHAAGLAQREGLLGSVQPRLIETDRAGMPQDLLGVCRW